MPWEELHLSWALLVPDFSLTLLLSVLIIDPAAVCAHRCCPAGQHRGLGASACAAGSGCPKEPHPPGACRIRVVQSLGIFLGIKALRKMSFCISFCIQSLLNGSVLMCPIDSSDGDFWDQPRVAELSVALVLGCGCPGPCGMSGQP